MLFLHLSFFLLSQKLFYLPGAHKFPSQYRLTNFLCLPHKVLKDTLSDISLPGQTLFSYSAPPETLRTLWLLQDFWLPQGSPAVCGVVKKLSCKIWEAEDPKGTLRYIYSTSFFIFNSISFARSHPKSSPYFSINLYIIETHKNLNWENIQVGLQNWSNICSHMTLQDNTSVTFFSVNEVH